MPSNEVRVLNGQAPSEVPAYDLNFDKKLSSVQQIP